MCGNFCEDLNYAFALSAQVKGINGKPLWFHWRERNFYRMGRVMCPNVGFVSVIVLMLPGSSRSLDLVHCGNLASHKPLERHAQCGQVMLDEGGESESF